ncbi:MAG: hypothetical protein QOH90_1768 [Actinomycetota bacterium]|jgi:hypothetical protein|nr:hypothetical protein [Actinomycetota bacterium]
MLRKQTLRIVAVCAVLAVCGAVAAPGALGKKPLEKRGGKKPIAEVLSFDPGSLQLDLQMNDGSESGQTVDAGVQIKVEHRGAHAHGKGHGNPSRGTLADLVPGTKVLRMKLTGGVVTKLRLRRAAAPATETPASEPDDGDEEAP